MHYVEFTGDPRLIAARAIKAVTGEDASLNDIYDPCNLTLWRGKSIGLFMLQVKEDVYSLLHHSTLHKRRPWSNIYPTALSICEGAVNILFYETYENHFRRILGEKTRFIS